MGQIASEFSDLIILTEDDNYSEDVHEIMKDVIPGIERKE
jgi:UDP-N-acetylmuramyl tripeptide synthase